MTEPMTPERLAEIHARAEAATEGPWLRYGTRPYEVYADPDAYEDDSPFITHGSPSKADAVFIQHARLDVPDLRAEVDRLRIARDERHALAEHRARMLNIERANLGDLSRERDRLAEQVARVRALFDDGGPDTPCRTVWRGRPGWTGESSIECVEVPLADLRAVLGGAE